MQILIKVKTVEKFSKRFNIRAKPCEHLTNELLKNRLWEKIGLKNISYEVSSIEFLSLAHDKGEEDTTYKLVVAREKTDKKQLDLLTGGNKKYRSITPHGIIR